MATTATPPQETAIDQSMHALPKWFAGFQKTFGLTFLVACSAYLMGKLATLGWVRDLLNPVGWGWFDGAGVVLFFLGGVTISGIALTCSLTFARTIQMRPFRVGNFILAAFTFVGMFLFFGIEVWASLAERSTYLIATPVDHAVLSVLGFHGTPPISPTVVIVSVMFPLGSLFFGFVQQGRQRTTTQDIADEDTEMDRKIHRARKVAELRQAQAKGLVGVAKGAYQAATTEETDAATPDSQADAVALNGHSDTASFN